MSEGTGEQECSLVRRVAAGDEEAFRAVYEAHAARIYRYALHMMGQADRAEEVLQETFLVLLRQPEQFDPQRGNLAQFLLGVARNQVRRLLQEDGRYMELPEERPGVPPARPFIVSATEEAGPWAQLTREEAVERVWKAIRTLPEHYREVLVLCELEGMPYSEVAAALHLPVGTVRSRLQRARRLLTERLAAVLHRAPVGLSRKRAGG